jgi:hypothetical protein
MSRPITTMSPLVDRVCASSSLACTKYCPDCGECLQTRDRIEYSDASQYDRDRRRTLAYRNDVCPFQGPCERDLVLGFDGLCRSTDLNAPHDSAYCWYTAPVSPVSRRRTHVPVPTNVGMSTSVDNAHRKTCNRP